jgi:hypothetical protein
MKKEQNNPVKKYCRECGALLQMVDCSYYDEYTGEKVKQLICPTYGCSRNCEFFGHEPFIFSNTCKKCKKYAYYL